jgi:hypothetical protein
MSHLTRILSAAVVLFLLALAGVWTAGLLSPGYTLDLGPQEWGRIQDANDWEEHGSFTYRWTQGVTRFRLPVLGTPRRLTLRLDGSRPPGVDPAPVALELDGHPVVTLTPPAGPYLYHIAYDGPSAWQWETVVEVRTTPFHTANDPRELGVIVDWLHFSPPLLAPGPAWVLIALWTGLGIAVAVLGLVLGWPRLWSGIMAVLALLAMSALLAGDRPAALPWTGLLLAVALAGNAVAWGFRVKETGAAPERLHEAGEPLGSALQTSDGRPGAFALVVLILALAVATLPLLASWLPSGGSWALQMLEPFYPVTGPIPRRIERWLALIAVALVAIPAVNREVRQLVAWLWEAGRRLTPRVRPAGRWLLLGLLFVPLAYALRAQVLWGDGPSLVGRIGAGYLFNEPEMLPFFLHGMLYRWTEQLWGWSVPDVYTLTSLVCGALYVALAAALGDALGRDHFERSFVFGLLATLATIQFGFGYLENYALVTVALLALFWQMIRCLRGQGSPVPVAVLWVVACACHLQALLVGPAVLYTVIRAWKMAPVGKRWRPVLAALAGGVITAGLLLGLFLAGGYDIGHLFQGNWARGNNPYFLVPLQSNDTYTLFSLQHLANLVNEHVLVAPVVLPLLLVVALWHRRQVSWRDPVLIVLALSAAGLLLFASTLYPDLSAATDWDLFAPAALPYTLLAGLLFTRAVPEGAGKRYAATVLLVAAGIHAGMWVLLNARML